MAASLPATMRAAVVHSPGGPSALTLQDLPVPIPSAGQVLIRVRAFGLNRAEMFTRQGHSPDVTFPRVLGIEATGTVASAPGGEFAEGATVATVMGGLGRVIDGGYAEYTLVPARHVKAVAVDVGWAVLGALPEMLQTAWGAMFGALTLEKGEKFLVRGGTSSVALAAVALGKWKGAEVVATTRRKEREGLLRGAGAGEVVVDRGSIEEEVKRRWPGGFDKVLELVGVVTLEDSLRVVRKGGIVCAAGIVGGSWEMERFTPNRVIPSGTYLTTYWSSVEAFMETPLDKMARLVKEGVVRISIKTYRFDEIVKAHQIMDEGNAEGKMVVLVD
ncbi:hypothetical protein MMC13_004100 [Lambiella insularis]|nr:hypothetical protein [Lambiella insularis]